MKRFHMHIAVDNIDQNVRFYSTLFGAARKPAWIMSASRLRIRRMLEQRETSCCYAKSNKYWAQDPQGIAWEAYENLGEVPVFGDGALEKQPGMGLKPACCALTQKIRINRQSAIRGIHV